MTTRINLLINRQIQRSQMESQLQSERPGGTSPPRPVITISRTLGSLGDEIACCVAKRLHCQLYDCEILDKIAERSETRRGLVEAVDKLSRSRIESWIEGMLHQKMFDADDYHHHMVEVIYTLAELGSVVIVGRGAHFLLRKHLGLDVRIIAPLQVRIHRVMELSKISASQAEKNILESDCERRNRIKRIFRREWEDPCGYDLTLNTEHLGVEEAALIVETSWHQRVQGGQILDPGT